MWCAGQEESWHHLPQNPTLRRVITDDEYMRCVNHLYIEFKFNFIKQLFNINIFITI